MRAAAQSQGGMFCGFIRSCEGIFGPWVILVFSFASDWFSLTILALNPSALPALIPQSLAQSLTALSAASDAQWSAAHDALCALLAAPI